MKRNLFIILPIALSLCLAACSPAPAGGDTGDGGGAPVSEGYQPPPSPDGPVYEGSDIAGSPFVGTFSLAYSAIYASNAEEVYADTTVPCVTCREDGTFTMTVNDIAGDGVFEVSGTFTVDGETALFTVDTGLPEAFASSDTFSLTMRNDSTARYSGAQIATASEGDIFEK